MIKNDESLNGKCRNVKFQCSFVYVMFVLSEVGLKWAKAQRPGLLNVPCSNAILSVLITAIFE